MDRTPPDDIPDEDDHHVENEATAEDQRLQEPDKVGTRQKPVSQQEPTGAKSTDAPTRFLLLLCSFLITS